MEPAAQQRRRSIPGRIELLFACIPLGLACGYLIWVLANFTHIIRAIGLNPDATWAPVLARDLLSGGERGLIYVGEASHFTTIWFLIATRGLPMADLLWDVTPYLTFLAGLGLTAWACWKAAGRWAALLGLSIGVCAGGQVLLTVMSQGIHGHTFFLNSLLAAFLVLHHTSQRCSRWSWRLPAGTLVVILAGTTLASDPLFLPSGLLPFCAAPLALALIDRTKRNRELAVVTAALSLLSVITSVLFNQWMYAVGFRKTYATEGYALASPREALRNLLMFVNHTVSLGNGGGIYSGRTLDLTLRTVGEVGMMVFLVAAAGFLALRVIALMRLKRQRGWTEQPLSIFILYWSMSAVAIGGAFVLSTFALGPSDTSRYVIPVFFSLAAVAVVPARRAGWRRAAVVAGTGLFCLLSIANRNSLFVYEQWSMLRETGLQGSKIVSFLEDEQVNVGYSGYFNSHPLTYASDMQVSAYPVTRCRIPKSERLCPFPVNARSVWYRPRPGIRSFVLSDSNGPEVIAKSPKPELGPPSASRHFGSISIYIYNYDVASRLAPPCPLASPQVTCPAEPASSN